MNTTPQSEQEAALRRRAQAVERVSTGIAALNEAIRQAHSAGFSFQIGVAYNDQTGTPEVRARVRG